MELSSSQVYEILKDKGVKYLYHANTLKTALHFIKHNKLISRGNLEELGLEQTPQKSDNLDMSLGIWYDVFFDTLDLGEKFPYNKYGPVLFCFDIELLKEYWLPNVWITKSNPIYWNSGITDRWMTAEDLSSSYNPVSDTAYKNHIVIRNAGGIIRLKKHLKEIVIDDPELEFSGSLKYLHVAQVAIYISSNKKKLPFKLRDRKKGLVYKLVNKEDIDKFFLPF